MENCPLRKTEIWRLLFDDLEEIGRVTATSNGSYPSKEFSRGEFEPGGGECELSTAGPEECDTWGLRR